MYRAVGAIALFCTVVLAGCAGDASSDDERPDDEIRVDESVFEGFNLKATSTTGVVRGIVLDATITPLANARVAVVGGGAEAAALNTTENGAFGFDSLEPGTYFLRVSKVGYIATQASVEVEAGESEPEIQKLVLQSDPVNRPFTQSYSFEGFIECSVSIIAVGFAACSTVSAFNDNFLANYTLERVPDWAQTEMHWDSTQQVNDGLALLYSAQGNSTLLDNYGDDRGPSPLMVFANQSTMAHYGVGNGTDLVIRVFNHPIEGTTPPDPVGGDDCLDRPALGGCATGVGMTIEQDFTQYTWIFYGYTPEEGWLFAEDGAPTPP